MFLVKGNIKLCRTFVANGICLVLTQTHAIACMAWYVWQAYIIFYVDYFYFF